MAVVMDCMVMPHSIPIHMLKDVEALIPNMMVFASVPLGGKRLDEVMPVGSP